MQVVCIQAHGTHVPGDLVDLPDGAAFSPVHFAEPGSPEALAAETAAAAATLAPPGAPAPAAAPAPAGTPPAPLKAPDAAKDGA